MVHTVTAQLVCIAKAVLLPKLSFSQININLIEQSSKQVIKKYFKEMNSNVGMAMVKKDCLSWYTSVHVYYTN